jgi:hypothetical protein
MVTGQPVRGSWWSHPLGYEIFSVNEQLDHHPDVLLTKLVSGKVTFVHRKLWSALFKIGSAQTEWQLKALKKETVRLLERVEAEGQLRTDLVDWPKRSALKPGDAARQLEQQLLVVSSQVHTDKGKHAKLLQTWEHWAQSVKYRGAEIKVSDAMSSIEGRLRELNERFNGTATLPWLNRS